VNIDFSHCFNDKNEEEEKEEKGLCKWFKGFDH